MTNAVGGQARDTAPAPRNAVELRGIWKRYGSVVACAGVDLDLPRGQITGLLGENGAGKSTLLKVLAGVVRPNAGSIHRDGVEVTVRDPADAVALGIGVVHQHLSLVEALPVWENVALGDRGRIERDALIREIEDVGERYGLKVDPHARVGALSAGQQQRVDLIRCLRRQPDILILDEPTSMLSRAECVQLFAVLRRLVQDEQRAVAMISHKLGEVLEVTDSVTVMRGGKVVARRRTADTDVRELARDMVGRDVALAESGAALGLVDARSAGDGHGQSGPAVLTVRDATVRAAGGPGLRGLSLEVRAGEILGIAGVDGNGQTTLVEVLSSLVRLERGSVEIGSEPVPTGVPGAMHAAGVAVIPEDRHVSGVVLAMTIAENLSLATLPEMTKRGFLSRSRIQQRARDLMKEYAILAPSAEAPVSALSGGNQQRVVLARELSSNPRVLVAAQPSRGLDVAAISYVNERLRRAAEEGAAVLLISSELEEVIALTDRIVVMSGGRIIGELAGNEVDLDRLGLLIGGQVA